MLVRHRQVDDGEHHENKGLQRDHQQVKDRPDQRQQELHDQQRPAAGARQLTDSRERQGREQQEDHLAGEQVAVQTQRQRDGARNKRDDFEDEVGRNQQHFDNWIFGAEGLQRELADEAAQALHLDAVVDDEEENGQRQRERDIEVRAGHDLQMLEARAVRDRRQQIHRQDVHGVEQQHPAENRESQRRDQGAGLVREGAFDLFVDLFDQQLDEILE